MNNKGAGVNSRRVKFCDGIANELLDVSSKTTVLFGACIASEINIRDIPVTSGQIQLYHDVAMMRLLSTFKSQFLFCCIGFELFSQSTQPSCWVIDLKDDRVWSVKFEFANVIYQQSGTVFEGFIVPPTTTKEGSTSSASVSSEFIIKNVRTWCGARPTSLKFITQQLNVWFNTPVSEGCWHRPIPGSDVFKFNIELPAWDPEEEESALALSSKIELIPNSIEIVRLYKTQYPFVYSLLPDDHEKANQIKSQLKTSVNSNNDDNNPQPPAQTIIIVPTIESELQIVQEFQSGNKNQFIRWKCGKALSLSNGCEVYWVPISKV
jgi:hypothetical protein